MSLDQLIRINNQWDILLCYLIIYATRIVLFLGSFTLARRACNNVNLRSRGCVLHVADSPWLGLHRISHPDAVPLMPGENDERKRRPQNDSISTWTRKQKREQRRKRLENATVNIPIGNTCCTQIGRYTGVRNLSISIDTVLEGELQTWMSLLWNVILRSYIYLNRISCITMGHSKPFQWCFKSYKLAYTFQRLKLSLHFS
jgi:hypothetical protein